MPPAPVAPAPVFKQLYDLWDIGISFRWFTSNNPDGTTASQLSLFFYWTEYLHSTNDVYARRAESLTFYPKNLAGCRDMEEIAKHIARFIASHIHYVDQRGKKDGFVRLPHSTRLGEVNIAVDRMDLLAYHGATRVVFPDIPKERM